MADFLECDLWINVPINIYRSDRPGSEGGSPYSYATLSAAEHSSGNQDGRIGGRGEGLRTVR